MESSHAVLKFDNPLLAVVPKRPRLSVIVTPDDGMVPLIHGVKVKSR